MNELKLKIENKRLKQLELIRNLLLKGNRSIFKNSIWKILTYYKIPEFDLTTDINYFKRFNNILQPINILKDTDIYCFKYKLYEGCSICQTPQELFQYLNPSIEINKDDLLNKRNVETIVKSRLTYYQCACL